MAAFGGIASSYHIELLDKPTIYWDFHSLLLGIRMMFSFMPVDETSPDTYANAARKCSWAAGPTLHFAAPGVRTSTMSIRAARNPRGK